MQIAPVNYENMAAPLDHLIVLRVQPPGRVDRLHVAPGLEVRVEHHEGATSRFQLEAGQAEGLLHALNTLAGRRARLAIGSADDVRFDIELGWRGRSVRIFCIGTPEDEAIAGVLQFAHEAFDREPMHARRQPASA